MTKLEEKLIELGYERKEFLYVWFCKRTTLNDLTFDIVISIKDNKITNYQVYINTIGNQYIPIITDQHEIDTLQQTFNIMQKDLEVLCGCEN